MEEQKQSETYINWNPESSETYTTFINFPEPSEWSCNVYGVTYHPTKGNHPNWFHRQMCLLLLGVRWVRDKESE